MKTLFNKLTVCYLVIVGSIALIIPNLLEKNYYGIFAYILLITAMILTIWDIKKTDKRKKDNPL